MSAMIPLEHHASTKMINALLRYGPLSVEEIKIYTRLKRSHVQQWAMRLMHARIIRVVGRLPSPHRRGNRPVLYDIMGR